MTNNDFGFDNSDFDLALELPFVQWLNPHKKRPVGLAIKHTEAEKANFKPDANWQNFTIEFEDKNEKMWISYTPKFIVLNGAKRLKKDISTNIQPLLLRTANGVINFDKNQHIPKQTTAFTPFIFIPVDDSGNLISTPLVLRASKICHRSLTQFTWEKWKQELLTVAIKKGLPFPADKELLASALARFVYSPTFDRDWISAKDNPKNSSEAWVCNGYESIEKNWDKIFITQQHPSYSKIIEYSANVPNYIDALIKVKPKSIEESEQEIIERYTNPETGEVNIPEHLLDNIPY